MPQDDLPQELLALFAPPLSTMVEAYIRRWCVYYVTTENYDRAGVHGLDPNHPRPRAEDAMPAPWRMRDCSQFALRLHTELIHSGNPAEAAACNEAKQIVLGWSWAQMAHEAGIELLPLHRGPLSTHPDFIS